VWPGKLLADSNFFIFFIYFNKIYIKILCYNNHAHTSLNQSSDSNDMPYNKLNRGTIVPRLEMFLCMIRNSNVDKMLHSSLPISTLKDFE